MSVKPIVIDAQEFISTRSYSDLYKELELLNFKPPSKYHQNTARIQNEKNRDELSSNICSRFTKRRQYIYGTQAESVHNALKVAIICGQCVGLFPVVGIVDKDFLKVRFKTRSIRFILSALMFFAQTLASALSLYRLLTNSITVSRIGYFSFYATTWLTTGVFLHLARKWQYLLKKVYAADLNEYIDPGVKFKCNISTVVFLTCALMEHLLSLICEISVTIDCFSHDGDAFENFIRRSYPWFFETGFPYHIFVAVMLPLFNMASTIIWSYSHLFIICISIYLSSILARINQNVQSHDGECLSSETWRKLREDYCRATKLVRSFDDVINSVVFVSFASDLFFVCFRLYHVFAHGLTGHNILEVLECLPTGPFKGYEFTVYLTMSLIFIIGRSMAVCLVAARIHSVSLCVAPTLYNVPSPSYCLEVQRFIEQVHGDTVALSGLKFFTVTKKHILTIAGTIVTYELVLLQING